MSRARPWLPPALFVGGPADGERLDLPDIDALGATAPGVYRGDGATRTRYLPFVVYHDRPRAFVLMLPEGTELPEYDRAVELWEAGQRAKRKGGPAGPAA